MQTLKGMEQATQANRNAAHDRVYGQPNTKPFFDFIINRFYNLLGIIMERALHSLGEVLMNVGAKDALTKHFVRKDFTTNSSE